MLSDAQIEAFIADRLAPLPIDGRHVCVLVPDGTRTCPLPMLLGAVHRAVRRRVSRLTILVALGTHAAMDDTHLTPRCRQFAAHGVLAELDGVTAWGQCVPEEGDFYRARWVPELPSLGAGSKVEDRPTGRLGLLPGVFG